jgi:hypothetical protein
MAMSEENFIDVDNETVAEQEEKAATSRGVIRCAYCKQVFANFVLVKKHIKTCPSNPNNP